MSNSLYERKKQLLAKKEKILEEIRYYDKRLHEYRTNQENNHYYDDYASSDSEEFLPNSFDTGPDIAQLKLEQRKLKICLQATQELSNLTVLQSETNVLVQDPQFDGESPITEPGIWKEVTAECRIDLVPFTITFYMHTPNRKFAPTLYRGLKVTLVKKAHEIELSNSVLHTIKRPSHAVEVIRSYAVSYRSRRTSLARLASKYSTSLFMEPHLEGGFILKCSNVLEVLWRLENKWSPVARFHHKLRFDLEYMDESYIKTITQAHKQLLDPSLQTDERTLLLAKIIATCLEARGPVDSESDLESKQIDALTEVEVNKDSEVMAPPKSLPKKTKKISEKTEKIEPKSDLVTQKRSNNDENDGGNAKKLKTGSEDNIQKKHLKTKDKIVKSKEASAQEIVKPVENTDINVLRKKNNQNVNVELVTNNDNDAETNKNAGKKRKNNDNGLEINKNNDKVVKKMKSNEEIKRSNVEYEPNTKRSKSSADIPNKELAKKPKSVTDSVKVRTEMEKVNEKEKDAEMEKGTEKEKDSENIGNKQTDIVSEDSIPKEKAKKNSNNNVPSKKLNRKTKMSIANDKKFDLITKKLSGNKENKNNNKISTDTNETDKNKATINLNKNKNKNIVDKQSSNQQSKDKKATKSKVVNIPGPINSIPNKREDNINKKKISVTDKATVNLKQKSNQIKAVAITKKPEIVKNKTTGNTKSNDAVTATERNANNIKNKVIQRPNKDKPKPNLNEEKVISGSEIVKNNIIDKKMPKIIITHNKSQKSPLKIQNPQKSMKLLNGNTKAVSGNTEKENGAKISKIPQKKGTGKLIIENNIVRASPRRLPTFKSSSQESIAKSSIRSTNIPRFMKTSAPKISK